MASVPKKDSRDIIYRGVKQPSPLGTGLFVTLRPLEILLQYGILARGMGSSLLHKVGLDTLPAGPPNTGTFVDSLGLSPYRLILLSMATGTVAKQIFWLTVTSEETFPPANALIVAAANTTNNVLNTLFFTTTAMSASLSSSAQFPQTTLLVGSALYALGMGIEVAAEVQRKAFKKDAKNEGKLCTQGLWSLSRHINYLGHIMCRTGFAIASGGWTWGAVTAAFWFGMFRTGPVPALEDYCTDKVS